MSKQETDARDETTGKDLESSDAAINNWEALGRFLYRSRVIIGEISKAERYCHDLKESIAHLEAQSADQARAFEHAKGELEEVQREEVETRQRLATLTAETEAKRRELEVYSAAIDKITKAAA